MMLLALLLAAGAAVETETGEAGLHEC